MTDGPTGADPATPEADLRRAGEDLVVAVERVLPGWVVRRVVELAAAWGGPVPDDLGARAAAAGRAAVDDVGPALRALVAADVDQQRGNPLDLLRRAVRHPTAVLRDAGVPGVVRDPYDEAHFPDDEYGLVPLAWQDVDPALHEPGLRWGAAKARAHLARHRPPTGA